METFLRTILRKYIIQFNIVFHGNKITFYVTENNNLFYYNKWKGCQYASWYQYFITKFKVFFLFRWQWPVEGKAFVSSFQWNYTHNCSNILHSLLWCSLLSHECRYWIVVTNKYLLILIPKYLLNITLYNQYLLTSQIYDLSESWTQTL